MSEKAYLNALIAELDQVSDSIQERELQSIFVGGGTPSLFSAEAYQFLFSEIKKRVAFKKNIEITLEANPGAVDASQFSGFYAAGINRLSLGAQSFQNEKLKKLGRIHQAEDITRAIEIAKKAGFTHFNIDLMFGLPQQTVEEALFDLHSAMAFHPTHLSWYQLTLEPQTFFYKHPPALPEEELIWSMQESGQALLSENGFVQYEVSAYAKANKQCVHNLNYWEFGDYIGLGAGAHSKITDIHRQQVYRIENIKSPKKYMSTINTRPLPQIREGSDLAFEFMLNALRLKKPIPISLYQDRTSGSLALMAKPLEKAQELELLDLTATHFIVTEKGHTYLNELLELFL